MNKVLKSITKIRQLGVPQKAMSMLFDCSTDNIELHLKNIFASWKLEKDSVTEIFSVTESNGKKYLTQFCKRQDKCLPNKQKNMRKRSLKSIVSYKTAYSKVTSIGLWMLFLLRKIVKNKTVSTINYHLDQIEQSGEIHLPDAIRKILIPSDKWSGEVMMYNLDTWT